MQFNYSLQQHITITSVLLRSKIIIADAFQVSFKKINKSSNVFHLQEYQWNAEIIEYYDHNKIINKRYWFFNKKSHEQQ